MCVGVSWGICRVGRVGEGWVERLRAAGGPSGVDILFRCMAGDPYCVEALSIHGIP